jgi:hypothetical protein
MKKTMQIPLTKQTSTAKQVLEHSSLGKTAFTLTLIGDFFLLFALLVAAIAQSNGNEAKPYFFVALYWIFVIPSTIMAIMDLNKPNRKKTLPKASLFLGLGMVVIVMVIAILAMVLFMATK